MDWVEGEELAWAVSTLALTEARLSIIRVLARRNEATLLELQEDLELSETTLRWHLRHLTEAGLLETRRQPNGVGRSPVTWVVVPEQLDRLRGLAARLL